MLTSRRVSPIVSGHSRPLPLKSDNLSRSIATAAAASLSLSRGHAVPVNKGSACMILSIIGYRKQAGGSARYVSAV